MEEPYPVDLSIDEQRAELVIGWSDGMTRRYGFKELRDSCPCATCREKRRNPEPPNPLRVLSDEELAPPGVAAMKPVGNYAYGIHFRDGHNTGIFTFETLRELGREEA